MKHKYIYRINFQVNAGDITEADATFMEEAHLFYIPDPEKKTMKGWMCPLVSVEIIRDPMLRVEETE